MRLLRLLPATMNNHHILYSYRRCPYAMRARMALVSAKIQCDVYDIDFKNKPADMLEISPKGTVPVLKTIDGKVIDESLDIVRWALRENDPEGLWDERAFKLIEDNDGSFKAALDCYKYPNRFPDEDCFAARNTGEAFLKKLDSLLSNQPYLFGERKTMADICIFPFVRQFANVDKDWFEGLPYHSLQKWLTLNLESDLFKKIIKKHDSNPYPLL